MADLQALFKMIEELPREQFDELEQFVEEQAQKMSDVDAWMNALDEAVQEFRQGQSEEELDAIIEGMNAEYIETDWRQS